jgi:hypothetical protein
VRSARIFDKLSKRVPSVVVLTFCAALLGAWLDAPLWLSNALAIIVIGLALLLLAGRGRRRQFKSPENLGIKEVIAYELAGEGTPRGSYLLGFFGFLTLMLIGFQSPYRMPAFSGIALTLVWGFVNARYPEDENAAQH